MDEWIQVTWGTGWDDKPRWSPDGNTIYFLSDRSGYPGLWAQRLAKETKLPEELPKLVYTFNRRRLSVAHVEMHQLEMAVAPDTILLTLGELTQGHYLRSLVDRLSLFVF